MTYFSFYDHDATQSECAHRLGENVEKYEPRLSSGTTQSHFCPSHKAGVKMSCVEVPKHIYTQEHKLYYYNYHSEGY